MPHTTLYARHTHRCVISLLEATGDAAKPLTVRNTKANTCIMKVTGPCSSSSTAAADDAASATPHTSTTTKVCTSWLGRSFELLEILPSSDTAGHDLYDTSDTSLLTMNIWGATWLCQYTDGKNSTVHGVKCGSKDNRATTCGDRNHDPAATAATAAERQNQSTCDTRLHY
jgi:hypothetical protein